MYNDRYFFTWYADRDVRIAGGVSDSYECVIQQLDYTGAVEELQAQENPVQINYQNTGDNVMQAIRGSEATLNLIATDTFQLEDLYTENEREFLVLIYRSNYPETLSVSWAIDETQGSVYVDMDLAIYVNGVLVVNEFTDASGTFTINNGDTLLIKPYGAAVTPGNTGMNIEITGVPTQRTTTHPFSIDTTITPTTDVVIRAYTTYSATIFTAIRSATFRMSCTYNVGSLEVFTKTYTSAISQADAQSQADADSLFNAEGQAYANSIGLCYSNASVIWRGFIIPDGCQEQFMFSPYGVSINATDILGLLKNLSYVQNDGNFWLGKQSFLEVIYNCLNRIEIPNMDLYTCVNIYEVNQTQGDSYDPLALTFVDSDRYLKDDGINPINCEEVLNAILQEWTATIIQSEGDFYVFRANELALSSLLTFRKYTNGLPTYDGFYIQKNLFNRLGGESEGTILAPLFHINTDQLKMIVKPYKNASISYKYGERKTLDQMLTNPTFIGTFQECGVAPYGPCDLVTIPGWTKTGVVFCDVWPTGGVIFYDQGEYPFPNTANYYQNDTIFAIGANFRLKLTIDYENPDPLYTSDMNFQIIWDDGIQYWYLQPDLTWSVAGIFIQYFYIRSELGSIGQLVVDTMPVYGTGTIIVRIMAPTVNGTARNIVYKGISASTFFDIGTQVGEIHTATQTGKFTHVPDTINVFNGDSNLTQYMGAMYLADLTTLTTLWNRRGISENVLALPYSATKEFLRIAVEEIQRMHPRPYVRFEGSIFGYFNPLTQFAINLLTGYFMPLSLSYDLQSNICKAVLARISNEEIAMDYTLEPDYGETTKVLVNKTP